MAHRTQLTRAVPHGRAPTTCSARFFAQSPVAHNRFTGAARSAQTGCATPNLDHRHRHWGRLGRNTRRRDRIRPHTQPVTSIVIPAHNEERVIGRLLDALLAGAPDAERPDIVVVCNGCTDGTAKQAGARPGVRVVEIPAPSKHLALRTGDEHARGFPRLYVDADVVIGAAGVRALAGALAAAPELLAAAPRRDLPLAGCGRRVRAYYRV